MRRTNFQILEKAPLRDDTDVKIVAYGDASISNVLTHMST